MREPPGVGAALNSLPQLPGCPQLPKAQISGDGGGGGGGVRSLGRSIHLVALADSGSARCSLGASSRWGWGAGPRERPSQTLSSPARHALSAGLWDTDLPPPPHFGFQECGRLRALARLSRSALLPGACSLQPRHSGSVWLWVTVGGGVDVLPRFPGPPWSSHAMVEDGLPETGDSPPQASTSLHFSKSFLLHQWACQAAGTCSPTQWRTGDLPDGQSSISLNL